MTQKIVYPLAFETDNIYYLIVIIYYSSIYVVLSTGEGQQKNKFYLVRDRVLWLCYISFLF